MVRVAIPIVQVTAPDGAKSLWVVALPYQEAVEAVKKLVPSDHTAELALRRWRSSPRLARLQPGEVRKMEPTLSKRPTYPNLRTSGAIDHHKTAMIERTKHTWFVSYKKSAANRDHARQTETFATEIEAKKFVQKVEEKGLFAGTINPHWPKRTISSDQIADWLDEG